MNIVIAIIIFSLIILFHEFGHFIVAKKCNVKVNEFCLGFGPKLLKFKKGETEYSLRLLPLGGACVMEGERTWPRKIQRYGWTHRFYQPNG